MPTARNNTNSDTARMTTGTTSGSMASAKSNLSPRKLKRINSTATAVPNTVAQKLLPAATRMLLSALRSSGGEEKTCSYQWRVRP
jgi:hypothetical protein